VQRTKIKPINPGFYTVNNHGFSQAHKNLKSIYLTFGYVGVAHWAAVDGRPQRWT